MKIISVKPTKNGVAIRTNNYYKVPKEKNPLLVGVVVADNVLSKVRP